MLDLVLGAGWIVKGVMLLLAVASVASWAVILFKVRELGAAERDTRDFLEAYLERPLASVYDGATENSRSPLAILFRAGYSHLRRLASQKGPSPGISPEQAEEIVKRLAWIQAAEAHRLERGLPFLATTGSAAPFVGLFGTVVGIINAFSNIASQNSASLAVVAPGIAEALAATAIGLFAAIPAVIAYNYSNARLTHLLDQLDAFRIQFDQLLRRKGSQAA